MRRFAELFAALDRTTSTNAKVAHMAAYFEAAAPADAAWAVFFLSGRRFKRLAGWNRLAGWARAEAGVPEWLFDASSDVVGDLAETIALLVEQTAEGEDAPLHEWAARLEGLRALDEESEQRARVVGWWRSLPPGERFLLNKMMTGALRVGVSRTLVVRALAEASGLERDVLQHRLSGRWTPSAAFYAALVDPDAEQELASRPYPFYLASPLEKEPAQLGAVGEWLAEWKWDGIRAQLVRRAGATHLWSRGEELITERFPEIAEAAKTLPDGTVLDGEVLCWDAEEERPMPFAVLQKRIGRTRLGPKILREAPARFLAYDLLEARGEDLRAEAQRARRARLEAVCEGRFPVSPLVEAPSWEGLAAKRAEARGRGVEGLMLKRADGPYEVGRRKGGWWKWKVDPLTVDAVLVYARAGHGKRAGLFTDYTFAVWGPGEAPGTRTLVTLAKAYSGLTNEEIRELDGWIRRHTLERFGPVRAVEPAHVFELAFEGLRRSKRHKSGVAVRFPRIARWRRDKRIEEANTLEQVHALLATHGG